MIRLLAVLLVWTCTAHAQLAIEITGAGAQRIPIALVPFAGENALAPGISSIVRADLERSGLFRGLELPPIVPGNEPTEATNINYAEWRSRLADALLVGSVQPRQDGRFEVRFRLFDVVKQTPLGGVAYTMGKDQVRATAHRIADYVYEKLTGEKGVFSTRIAYVVKRGNRYELQIADYDGAGAETALASFEPIISPVWSPDGKRLAYVSFENKKPVVYVHSLLDGKRHVVANFKGSNSAPAWAPDGNRLAVVLSREGGSQLFLINADGSGAQRLMSSPGIDTEANFSPDGRSILFTSDRGGTPQIYRLTLGSGAIERMTFDGSYNVSPRHLPDGRGFVFVRRDGGRFNIALQDFATRQVQVLTQGSLDESPSVAPNGKLIIYASETGGRGILAAVSSDGRVKQRLTAAASDVREPAWGPLLK